MSGIYIPGVEMPTTGLYLVSVDNSCGEDETVMTVKRMLGNRDVCQIIGAYNLVPVPEHGRTIDAFNTVKKLCDSGYYNAAEIVSNMPTIIPADADKEGE